MQLVNYMEAAVKNALDELLAEPAYKEMKIDEKAKLDIVAYSLNHLPSKYVVTEKGHLYTRINELKQQFQTDIVIELSKAITHVKAHPR